MPEQRRIPPPGIPPPEVDITEDLVRGLLAEQHPDLLDRELRLFGSGWDNTTYRLGDDLAVRVPRRQLGADMMVKEQQWLPVLAPTLPLPSGAPVRLGRPGAGYPWPWSIVPWIDGVSAEVEAPAPAEAARLGGFLRSLHKPAPSDVPRNVYRGGDLGTRTSSVEQRLERLSEADLGVPVETVALAWDQAKRIPYDTAEPTWLHGDIHPRNVIVDAGRIVAVIDWGDLCVGDPATDLAAVWMLFPSTAHQLFSDEYGEISTATWERARGWAIFFAVVMIDAGRVDDARWATCGTVTLNRLFG